MAKIVKSSHPIDRYTANNFDDQSAPSLAQEEAQLRAANAALNPKVRPGKKSLEYEIQFRKKLGPDMRTSKGAK